MGVARSCRYSSSHGHRYECRSGYVSRMRRLPCSIQVLPLYVSRMRRLPCSIQVSLRVRIQNEAPLFYPSGSSCVATLRSSTWPCLLACVATLAVQRMLFGGAAHAIWRCSACYLKATDLQPRCTVGLFPNVQHDPYCADGISCQCGVGTDKVQRELHVLLQLRPHA